MTTYTRIDIEQIRSGYLRIQKWADGWQEGGHQSPAVDQVVQGSLFYTLTDLEKQGYTVAMRDRTHGQALSGETTRVDIIALPDGWHVREYPLGWEPKTRPSRERVVGSVEAAALIAEYGQKSGWTLRTWQGGARAFKGQPQPVRDRSAIMDMRRRAEDELHRQNITGTQKIFADFAYDF